MSGVLAKLFQTLTHGVYVVGVAHDDCFNAFTAASVMHASYNPPLLALSINIHHSSYSLLKASGVFSVNVLKRGQLDFAANYAKPASTNKMAFAAWSPGRTAAPLLRDALAWFECKVTGDFPAGDHRLVLGKVISGEIIDPQAEPLTYRESASVDDVADLFPDALNGH
jgi:flavin reductase (DIM6/NTAB) family NADH-FMN oxidoreductase RutF